MSGSKSKIECKLSDSTIGAAQKVIDALLLKSKQNLFVDFEDHMNGSNNVDFRNNFVDEFIG